MRNFLRNLRAKQPVETSLELRQLLAIGQLISIFGLTWTAGVFMWPFGILFAAILIFGHRYSAKHAEEPIKRVRQIIFVALHIAFVYMVAGIAIGLPYPQGQMAMLGTALVSWEMFSRRNLWTGWFFALANLHVTAVLSRGFFFFIPLLGVGISFLAFLWLVERLYALEVGYEIPKEVNKDQDQTSSIFQYNPSTFANLNLKRFLPLFLGGVLLIGAFVFIGIPRFAGSPIVPPFTLRVPIRGGPQGQIVNPAVPIVQIQGVANTGETSEYYHGFDSRLDLSYRGALSEAIMMYVRSPARSYWRSHAYDYYDGRSWNQSEIGDATVLRRDMSDTSFVLDNNPPPGNRFVQTFYVVRPLPNLAFVGGSPVELFIPTEQVAIDNTGGIRLAETLEPGMTYSVLSVSAPIDAGRLQDALWSGAVSPYPEEITEKYLQLPDTVTQRTRDLAAELTRDLPTVYDKVVAIEQYVKNTFPYDLYPPPQKPNSDAVDQFLFVDQTGYCEHYVTAMVVMLRSQGIPARLVSGFGSGQYDYVNNLYEVRANHAHAWVEVYFPRYGWVPFEPTPGWNGDPQTGDVRNWFLSGAMGNVSLPTIPIGAVAQAAAGVMSAIFAPMAFVAGIGLVLFLIRRGWLWYQRRKVNPEFVYSTIKDGSAAERRRIIRHYQRLQKRNQAYRDSDQTVYEHAEIYDEVSEFEQVSKWVDVAAYRPEGPTRDEVELAEKVGHGK